MRTIVERAAARGEINLDQITARIAALPVDLLRREVFVTNAPVPDAVVLEIVEDVFLRSPTATPRKPTAGRSPPRQMLRGGSQSPG